MALGQVHILLADRLYAVRSKLLNEKSYTGRLKKIKVCVKQKSFSLKSKHVSDQYLSFFVMPNFSIES